MNQIVRSTRLFCNDTRGVILPYVTIMLVIVVGVAVLALDGARFMSLQTQLQNGADALAQLQTHSYDVLLADILMPGMDGYKTCAKIHETELNRNTPVIFVTNHKDFESRSESTRSGGSDFVVKPFLFVEITVKALTFALRNRLAKPAVAAAQPAPGRIESSTRQSEAPKTL